VVAFFSPRLVRHPVATSINNFNIQKSSKDFTFTFSSFFFLLTEKKSNKEIMKLLLALLITSASAFAPSSFTASKVSSAGPAAPTATQLYGEYGASSTSFYTTTEKQDSYESLDDVLDAKCADSQVRAVIKDMLEACADITEALRTALVTVEGSSNTFGDAQLSVDVSKSLTNYDYNIM
jgi:hypothetical protein